MSAILTVDGLTKRFGGVRAVDDCSLAVEQGTITGLIGPNGSGKTTVFNIITGYLRADAGAVRFAGRDVTGQDTGRLYRHGLSRTFQQAAFSAAHRAGEPGGGRRLHLVAAVAPAGRPGGPGQGRAPAGRVRAGCAGRRPGRGAVLRPAQAAGVRGRADERPRLVLLDEPTAGVNPVMIETMERHIRGRHAAGITFLIVEHDMTFVMRLCDPVVVLDAGRPIFAGPPAQVQSNPLVLDAYLGELTRWPRFCN